MYEAIDHFLNMPVPMWLFALSAGLLWFEQRKTRRWIGRDDSQRLLDTMSKAKKTDRDS